MNHDWAVWEPFSSQAPPSLRATPEQAAIVTTVITKIVVDHITRSGMSGVKKKRALRRLTERITTGKDASIRRIVQDATRLGVPYETLCSVVNLLK